MHPARTVSRRAIEEGLSEDELALFDLLKKEDLGKAARERVKQASRDLLASIKARLQELDRFWEKEQTKAEAKVLHPALFRRGFLGLFRAG